MNEAPDYSAAYVILETDTPGLTGHGMTFTTGRGNELCVAAIEALAPRVLGRSLETLTADLGAFWTSLVDDGQLRWVGPEKGVVHLATAAVVNAVWDLIAKAEGKSLWRLLADMSPEELVRCIPFRYISDALSPNDALAILKDGLREGTSESRACSPVATRLTRPPLGGSGIRISKSESSAKKAWPAAGVISS